MPKSSHSFQKRRREIDKKKKRDEKLQKKIDKKFETPATFEEMVTHVQEIQPDDGTDYSESEKPTDE